MQQITPFSAGGKARAGEPRRQLQQLLWHLQSHGLHVCLCSCREQGLQHHISLLLVQLSPGTGLSLLPYQNHLCNTGASQEGARESQGHLCSMLCPTDSASHQHNP